MRSASVLAMASLWGCGGGGHPTWSKTFGGPEHDELNAVAASRDQIVLAGSFAGGTGGWRSQEGDLWAMAVDDAGNLLWRRALGGRQIPGVGDAPPGILAVAYDPDGGFWLAGFDGSTGQALLIRTDADGGVVRTAPVPPHQAGRFEQAMSVAPVSGGAMAAIWAYAIEIESYVEGRHPAVQEVHDYEVGRWRPRFARVDDDGTFRWALGTQDTSSEWMPEALVIGAQPGGASVSALSLESTLAVVGVTADAKSAWVTPGDRKDDVVGVLPVPDGSWVVFGKSTRVSANADQGFAARYNANGDLLWHERFSEVDDLGAGTLACPASSSSCHLVLAGTNLGSFIPPDMYVLHVDLEGHVQAVSEALAFAYPRDMAYDPATDLISLAYNAWGAFTVSQLDATLAVVASHDLAGTGEEPQEKAVLDMAPDGSVLWYSRTRQLLREFGPGGDVRITVPFDAVAPRREVAHAVLVSKSSAVFAGSTARGEAWGVATDLTGNVLWQTTWDVPATGAMGLAPADRGETWVTAEGLLFRVDADGAPIWQRRVPDLAPRIAQARGGGVLAVVGGILQRLDDDGTSRWVRTYDGPGGSLGVGAVAPLGSGWLVAGAAGSGVGGGDDERVLVELTGAGDVRRAVVLSGLWPDTGAPPVVAEVGRLRVMGLTVQSDDADLDVLLVAVNKQGEQVWVRRYGGLLRDEIRGMTAAPSGGFVVAGASSTFGDIYEGWVLRLDAEGLVGEVGGCQALLDPPDVQVDTVEVVPHDAQDWLMEPERPAAAAASSVEARVPELVEARQCVSSADPEPPTTGTSGTTGGTGATGTDTGTPSTVDCSDVTPGEGFQGEPCRSTDDCNDGAICCTSKAVDDGCGIEVGLCECIHPI